jgi:hypothetical protein
MSFTSVAFVSFFSSDDHMTGLASVKAEAQAAQSSSNAEIQRLGKALYELCCYVDTVESKAEKAGQEAKYAFNEARGAMGEARR